uniref:CSON009235 protein n=1 Tax=Culicoides sonorensis TaxID=179676 RepID=A0A336M3N7_CULSO
MGNETSSQLKGLIIDKKAVEVTDFYSLNLGHLPYSSSPNSAHDSTTNKNNRKSGNKNGNSQENQKLEQQQQLLAIFQNDDPLQTNFIVDGQNPLTRAIHNIKIYRHPNILKYVAAWTHGTNSFLATENCKPLSAVLSGLNDIQICIGLKSVLGAVAFLVEQAKARHLNICISSIYVNDEGQWKLFGFEHVWKSSNLTPTIIEKSSTYRYKKAVAKDEIQCGMRGIEQYAFAVLCDDLLKQKTKGSIPHIEEFRDYCMKHLKHEDTSYRPSLSAILLHPYFNHDFILIHSYLTELPLKSHESKQEFFSTLLDRLRQFDEEIVASQLAGLLLSRLVLLDMTAKNCFIPYLLKPKNIDDIPEGLIISGPGLFTQHIFQKYLIPRLKQAFAIKDSQIRIALLEYFPSYVEMFAKDDLRNEILPQLLLGIKDTNDFLVSRTLLCMADLVPILGATQVIGGNRTKIFSDGRPQGPETQIVKCRTEPRSITPVITSAEHLLSESPVPEAVDISGSFTMNGTNGILNEIDLSSNVEETDSNMNELMPERLTPEGEEMENQICTVNTAKAASVENEDWSDWENQPLEETEQSSQDHVNTSVIEPLNVKLMQRTAIIKDNIDELDIKNQTFKKIEQPEEFDYFKDMEPVIKSTNLSMFDAKPKEGSVKPDEIEAVSSTRLNISVQDTNTAEHGWGDDDAWGE